MNVRRFFLNLKPCMQDKVREDEDIIVSLLLDLGTTAKVRFSN